MSVELLGLVGIGLLGLMFIQAPFVAYTVVWAGTGVIASCYSNSTLWLTVGWLAFAAWCLLFHWPYLRRLWIQPIFHWMKRQLPAISETERVALKAGDVWWESKLLAGRPDWPAWERIPLSQLSLAETDFLNHQVEKLCQLLDDWQITHHDLDLPPAVWAYLKKEKFFGMIIPEAYGGRAFSALAHSTVIQKIASRSVAAAVTTMVPNSLGPAELLLNYGTEAQKQHYLPRLACGEEIPCFALTGPEVGSDAASMPDKGIVCWGEFQGEEVLGIRLTWSKRYITLAPIATVLGLAFKLYDPDNLLSPQVERGITLCLIPTTHPGVQIGKRHLPLDQAFLNGPTSGTDVFVPLDWIIGGPPQIGHGWAMLMACLAAGRGISLPALSTALGKLCYRTTGAYASVREQFQTPIGSFEGVQASLAKIAGFTFLLESMRVVTASILDQNIHSAVIAAIVKYHTTELARQVVNHAMDVHGGKAIMMGRSNYLARAYESIPISITVEGANLLTRHLMIFGQGVTRCHPYLLEEMEAADVVAFEKPFLAHVSALASTKVRLGFHLLTGKWFCVSRGAGLERHQKTLRHLNFYSLVLSYVTELSLIVLGGQLKRKERLSARLGDMLSHLYMAACVLRYARLHQKIEEFQTFSEWALHYCVHQCQEALWDFLNNFTWRWAGLCLRWMIFPFGKRWSAPSDQLEAALATQTETLTQARSQLTCDTYVGTSDKDAVAQLEQAFALLPSVRPLWKKIRQALKDAGVYPQYRDNRTQQLDWALEQRSITASEHAALKQYEVLRLLVIQVDDFDIKPLGTKR